MDKERALTYLKNNITKLKDDLSREEYSSVGYTMYNVIEDKIFFFQEPLEALTEPTEKKTHGALISVYGVIRGLKNRILYEENQVKKDWYRCELEQWQNIRNCLKGSDVVNIQPEENLIFVNKNDDKDKFKLIKWNYFCQDEEIWCARFEDSVRPLFDIILSDYAPIVDGKIICDYELDINKEKPMTRARYVQIKETIAEAMRRNR